MVQRKNLESKFNSDDEFLTAEEIAKCLRVHKSTILTLYHNGKIPGLRLGVRILRFRLEDVQVALASADTGKIEDELEPTQC